MRYLKIVLTIIAIELLWLGLKDTAPPALALAQAPPARVVITGVEVPIEVRSPLKVEVAQPLRVVADRPLPVEAVPYTPSARPGG